MEGGEYLTGLAPYGYKKSEENNKKLVVDAEVSEVIMFIFKQSTEEQVEEKVEEQIEETTEEQVEEKVEEKADEDVGECLDKKAIEYMNE